MRFGTVNAGLLDQTFALQWVQSYVSLLGGNASRVTVAGEEAGAGSVMLQAMAFGGHLGDSLFTNVSILWMRVKIKRMTDSLDPRPLAISSQAVCLWGLCPVTSILRIRIGRRLLWAASASTR